MNPQAQPFRPRAHVPPTLLPSFQVQPPQMQMYHPRMPNYNENMYYQYIWLPQPPPQSTVPPPSPTPTRTLLLYMVPMYVSDTTVLRELRAFWEVKSVEMERLQEGIVIVHFYDLRHSAAALAAMQNHYVQQQHRVWLHYTALPPLAFRAVARSVIWAEFYAPTISPGSNQGILRVRNLDPEIPPRRRLEILESLGAVNEVRETPLCKHLWYVEYFDIRDAAKALSRLDGKKIRKRHLEVRYITSPDGHS